MKLLLEFIRKVLIGILVGFLIIVAASIAIFLIYWVSKAIKGYFA
jgi:hypothetical protein